MLHLTYHFGVTNEKWENYHPHRIKPIFGAVVGDSSLQDTGVAHYLLSLLFRLVSLPFSFDFCVPKQKYQKKLLLWVPMKILSCVTSPVTTTVTLSALLLLPPATSAPSYEIKPALLNLVMKDQFSGVGEDAALHLNNFLSFVIYKSTRR